MSTEGILSTFQFNNASVVNFQDHNVEAHVCFQSADCLSFQLQIWPANNTCSLQSTIADNNIRADTITNSS